MAKASIKSFVTDSKNRTTLFFMAIVGIAVTILGFVFFGGEDAIEGRESTSVSIPKNIDITPGSELPERYRDLQVEENIRRAEEAKKTGDSAIPTIVGGLKRYDFDLPQFQNKALGGLQEQGFGEIDPEIQFTTKPEEKKEENVDQLLQTRRTNVLEDQDRRRRERQELLNSQREDKEAQRALEKQVSLMQGQAKAMFSAWSKVPSQEYVTGKLTDEDFQQGTVVNPDGTISTTSTSTEVEGNVVKAGTVMFAVLDTAINTDEPGPVLATMVQGPYIGAKLVGNITFNPGFKKVIIEFNLMSVPNLTNSVAVNAVAIDSDTARTALADDVDNHYFTRYGALFASSFLEGYGDAVKNQGTTTVAADGSTTSTTDNLDTSEEIYSALGNVGKAWGQQIGELFNRDPTVTVNQGAGLGILFLEDATIPFE